MERITDWAALWRELAAYHGRKEGAHAVQGDPWRDRARRYDKGLRDKGERPDSSRDAIAALLQPTDTLLDIGAGTGRLALTLARSAGRVTALDPSPAMLEVLQENRAARGLTNVDVIEASWPEGEAQVEPHDYTLCAHGLYGTPDLPAFVRAMMRVTRKQCFLVLRFPLLDAPMAVLAQHIWGQPHDSSNGYVAYNVLVQMGIYPDVRMESSGLWRAWSNATLDEAVQETKRRFGLEGDGAHDGFIRATLAARLTQQPDGTWLWPPGVRSGLLSWSVAD